MRLKASVLILSFLTGQWALAQTGMQDGEVSYSNHNPDPSDLIGAQKAITTAVPFLAITPDSRHAALGDAGVATTPDANSAYWNAGKLAFIDKRWGVSLSVNPWLAKIVNDMWISSLTGYMKFSREQAVGFSLKYFDLGDISFRDDHNNPLGDFNPREFSFDGTYSRMLSEFLGVGVTARFISSNLTGAFSGSEAQTGRSVAADIGVYYSRPLQTANNSTLSLGAQLSNVGAKISYTDNANRDFLPTNLRLGGAYTTSLDPFNTLTFALDFNKLMVPTIDENQTLLSGMFESFSDAPGGASEELHEIMTSIGVEYWYRDVFAARLGYFNEAKDKGNRKYLTAGIGFQAGYLVQGLNNFVVDLAYIVPTNQREHPLAETLRFSIMLQLGEANFERETPTN